MIDFGGPQAHGNSLGARVESAFTVAAPLRFHFYVAHPFQDDALLERVVSSRNRVNPRGVKKKMSNYNLRPGNRRHTRRVDVARNIVRF